MQEDSWSTKTERPDLWLENAGEIFKILAAENPHLSKKTLNEMSAGKFALIVWEQAHVLESGLEALKKRTDCAIEKRDITRVGNEWIVTLRVLTNGGKGWAELTDKLVGFPSDVLVAQVLLVS